MAWWGAAPTASNVHMHTISTAALWGRIAQWRLWKRQNVPTRRGTCTITEDTFAASMACQRTTTAEQISAPVREAQAEEYY